jgi:hypothetical protein
LEKFTLLVNFSIFFGLERESRSNATNEGDIGLFATSVTIWVTFRLSLVVPVPGSTPPSKERKLADMRDALQQLQKAPGFALTMRLALYRARLLVVPLEGQQRSGLKEGV